MPDPVYRAEEVAHADGVQPPPLPGGEDAGVDLQVQMPVWIAGAGGVVPHQHRFQHLDRHLDLPAARPYSGGRVLGQPADHLGRRLVLCGVVGGGDVGVQGGGQRPGLRPVDDHLDEAHRTLIGAQPPPWVTGIRIAAGHPCLVAVAGKRRALLHAPVAAHEAAGQTGALGQVVVVGATPADLQAHPGQPQAPRRTPPSHRAFPEPPNNDQQVTPRNDDGPRKAEPDLPLLVACVPFSGEHLSLPGKGWSGGREVVAGVMSLVVHGDCRLRAVAFSRLQVLMTISSAMHRLASRGLLRHGGVDVERQPDDEAATVRQGVPVVLPVRGGSPGGSYGTADEGHLLCRAVFLVEVPFRTHIRLAWC